MMISKLELYIWPFEGQGKPDLDELFDGIRVKTDL